MDGFSMSLMRLDPDRAAALSAPVGPAAWSGVTRPAPVTLRPLAARRAEDGEPASGIPRLKPRSVPLCDRLLALEAELNRLDGKAGDGDTGSTLAAGARPQSPRCRSCRSPIRGDGRSHRCADRDQHGRVERRTCSRSSSPPPVSNSPRARLWTKAFRAGLARMQFYGGAA